MLFRIQQVNQDIPVRYMFLAATIIKTARYGVMKLPAKFHYKDVYEKCLS